MNRHFKATILAILVIIALGAGVVILSLINSFYIFSATLLYLFYKLMLSVVDTGDYDKLIERIKTKWSRIRIIFEPKESNE